MLTTLRYENQTKVYLDKKVEIGCFVAGSKLSHSSYTGGGDSVTVGSDGSLLAGSWVADCTDGILQPIVLSCFHCCIITF